MVGEPDDQRGLFGRDVTWHSASPGALRRFPRGILHCNGRRNHPDGRWHDSYGCWDNSDGRWHDSNGRWDHSNGGWNGSNGSFRDSNGGSDDSNGRWDHSDARWDDSPGVADDPLGVLRDSLVKRGQAPRGTAFLTSRRGLCSEPVPPLGVLPPRTTAPRAVLRTATHTSRAPAPRSPIPNRQSSIVNPHPPPRRCPAHGPVARAPGSDQDRSLTVAARTMRARLRSGGQRSALLLRCFSPCPRCLRGENPLPHGRGSDQGVRSFTIRSMSRAGRPSRPLLGTRYSVLGTQYSVVNTEQPARLLTA